MQIEFENVSKYFFVPSKELSFRQAFISFSKGKQIKKEVLNNIHFSIQKGEFVGIIGPNGCGKSTILKLIGGILWPNVGRITVIGKVAPLLELGAGFHPDLTGRENIYLYGSILGFKKKEIDQKFEEMVLFSEMKDFLNLKIKHYSSGMAARLGLSVAIHMDYDILIADEVLSVGDVSFQKKCLERICSDHENGKTILFVSHQHDLIYRLAERVMMIEGGKVQISKNERRASHLKSPEINLSDFE